MITLTALLWTVIPLALTSWFGWQLTGVIKRDGYGMSPPRLPGEEPTAELPSTPYSITPPR